MESQAMAKLIDRISKDTKVDRDTVATCLASFREIIPTWDELGAEDQGKQ